MYVFCGYILSVIALPIILSASMQSWNPVMPPVPRYGPNTKMLKLKNSPEFIDWSEECGTNLWEHCELFEGDIMLYNDSRRNGLLNESYYWPKAVIPFYIDSKDFDGSEIGTILGAFEEYHKNTCIRFRPYQEGDSNFIVFKGNYSGCWSSVGMRKGGQVLNLSTPKCVTHGIVIHELLHAVGFYHQQSATDRDEYVKIQWENILEKHQHNFNKYDANRITDFDVGYDFGSIMHYSEKAFSKNGNPTIVPLRSGVKIGQRKGLSPKDIEKLSEMYDGECDDESSEENFDFLQELIKFFQQFLGK
ncbi:seminal metalloprotease 1 [Eupeodes corollae]|uniref:seminal metalloprotease 1 n=1 Tax=Eupeodes corollae TaxID=290404 RepID=UPI0024900C61|nr:seminal metalloprotease 1 [Eupeodes corollae]